MLKAGLKSAGFLLVATLFLFCTLLLRLFLRDAGQRRRLAVRATAFFADWAMQILGVRVRFNDLERLRAVAPPRLLVANHLSTLDVLILAALNPGVFVTSIELRDTPFMGAIAKAAGCCFAERRNPVNLPSEIDDVCHALEEGYDVILFPEGTSSNGSQVLPFKNAFFEAAIRTGTPIVPICLNYRRIDGEGVTTRNRDDIFFYGDIAFPPHFMSLGRTKQVDVECRVLKPIVAGALADRRSLCQASYDAVFDVFMPIGEPGEEPVSVALHHLTTRESGD